MIKLIFQFKAAKDNFENKAIIPRIYDKVYFVTKANGTASFIETKPIMPDINPNNIAIGTMGSTKMFGKIAIRDTEPKLNNKIGNTKICAQSVINKYGRKNSGNHKKFWSNNGLR